jgi:uncharacterized protein (TIRG00374 family)
MVGNYDKLAAPNPRSSNQRLWLCGKAFVSAGILGFLLYKTDFGPVEQYMTRSSSTLLAVAFATIGIQVFLAALRWKIVNQVIGIRMSVETSLGLVFVGSFFSQILPSTVGGDAVRAWYLFRQGNSAATSANSVIQDRLAAMFVLLVLIGVTLAALASFAHDAVQLWSLGLLLLGGFSVFAFFGLTRASGGRWSQVDVVQFILRISSDARKLLTARWLAFAILSLSLALHLMTVVTIYVLAIASVAEVTFWECLVIVPPVLLIIVVPISIAGWGLREGAMVTAFSFVGVSSETALAVSLLYGTMILLWSLPGGAVWAILRARP